MRTFFPRAFPKLRYEDRQVPPSPLGSAHVTFSRFFSHDSNILPCSIFLPVSWLPKAHPYSWSNSVWVEIPEMAVSYLHAGHGTTARLKPSQLSRDKILMKQSILASKKPFYAAEVRILFTLRWVVRDWKWHGSFLGIGNFLFLDPVLVPWVSSVCENPPNYILTTCIFFYMYNMSRKCSKKI